MLVARKDLENTCSGGGIENVGQRAQPKYGFLLFWLGAGLETTRDAVLLYCSEGSSRTWLTLYVPSVMSL